MRKNTYRKELRKRRAEDYSGQRSKKMEEGEEKDPRKKGKKKKGKVEERLE